MSNQESILKQKHKVWLLKLQSQKDTINDHLQKIEHYADHPGTPYSDYGDELERILNKKLSKVNRIINLVEHEDQLVDEHKNPSELEISYALIENLMGDLDNDFNLLEKWFAKIDSKETPSINK